MRSVLWPKSRWKSESKDGLQLDLDEAGLVIPLVLSVVSTEIRLRGCLSQDKVSVDHMKTVLDEELKVGSLPRPNQWRSAAAFFASQVFWGPKVSSHSLVTSFGNP